MHARNRRHGDANHGVRSRLILSAHLPSRHPVSGLSNTLDSGWIDSPVDWRLSQHRHKWGGIGLASKW
ncbi:unnamed protein product [Protopolystoma xenopodis]|uniref:Uncharacterized protein n=1 Tax=Protopolystoma xenopodis TaxID=117903 RepID=A0A3S5FER7_9PLAT|nr:unnamed protein product [Protopolystoma xenopodis]